MYDYAELQKWIADFTRNCPESLPETDEDLAIMIVKRLQQNETSKHYSFHEQRTLTCQIIHAMRGLDVLQPLMDNADITEIMVNGPNNVFIERSGKLEKTAISFAHKEHLTHVISRFFGRANRTINEQNPIADMRLNDGSRVHAVLPPASPDGPTLTVRRFVGIRPNLTSLIDKSSISIAQADFLVECVKSRQNIFVSGGTGTGKTTFLNALSASIPPEDRIVTIEDAAELNLQGLPNVVKLEGRPKGPDGSGEITLRSLVRSALRLRPDRIIVGEVRGDEAFDMIQAMQTGHPGSMSTGHGNSNCEMLERLALMLMMASNLPWDACLRLVVSALDLMIHLTRDHNGRRYVSEIATVTLDSEQKPQISPLNFSTRGNI